MLRAVLLAVGLLVCGIGSAIADPLAAIRAGNQAFAEGRLEQALAEFSRAIEEGGLDGESLALAHNNRGVVLGELGDFDRAIADYEAALRLKPGDAKSVRNLRIAHTRRALAAARLGEAERAIADLGRAIELEPSHPTAYVRRAELHLERGEAKAAIEDLETATRLAPDNREARTGLDRARATLAARAAPAPAQPPSAPPAGPAPTAEAAVAPAAASAPPGAAGGGQARQGGPASGSVDGSDGPRFRVSTDVFVRAEPLTTSNAIGSLRRGAEFTARGEDKGWFRVELADGRSGWVYRRFLEPVAPPAQ